ncbi:acyltransferase [Burkholderia pyrrocinia]|uniref:Acyltransferase n=1 Tax=Burkholderia pyrrocinia TaxID=60550 RepID=A0A2Z5N524_BURPY|nr:acyltransferase [Burkholderia pyrrocinia]AXF24653.1 acyltransferase [Burkholderia pyrrocinia]
MNTLSQRQTVFSNIQRARAVAALAVVGYHMHVLPFGQNGIDVFFVIGGFIMSCAAPREGRAFLGKRLIRIVPLYWLTTLGVYAIAVLRPQWLNTTTAGLDYLVKSLLFVPYVDDSGHRGPLNPNGWTLEYEMLFYLAVAASLRFVRARYATALAALLLALVCVTLGATGATVVAAHPGMPLMLEFGLGVLAYWTLETGIGSRIAASVWAALAAASVAALALLPALHDVPSGFARVAGWGGPACVLIVSLVALELHGRKIANRLAMALGAASYSIYLIHPFVIGIAGKIIGARADLGTSSGIAVTFACLVAICASGFACHVWIEKPMLAMLDRWFRRVRPARDPSWHPVQGNPQHAVSKSYV